MVRSFQVNGQRFWLKRAGEDKHRWYHRMLPLLSRGKLKGWLNSHAYIPPNARLFGELKRLLALSLQGLPVVQITSFTDHSFITKDAGVDAKTILEQSTEKREIVGQLFDALGTLHQAGVVHGRPALRDIAISASGKVTFLDFEESPTQTTPELMARDAIILINECHRIPDLTASDVQAGVAKWRMKTNRSTWHAMCSATWWLLALLSVPAKLSARWSQKPRKQRLRRALATLSRLTKSPLPNHFFPRGLPFGF
ncbi:BUD32 family EKC/KEOPS complex subunit [Corallincola holothuriorum]|uniref:hypothetical protein n=1 Tax=Corallincola holothuriorum TaxID=2282215 RepID=UPI0011C072AA|nr:hypothetical protein [Corallincola holothuriorum]